MDFTLQWSGETDNEQMNKKILCRILLSAKKKTQGQEERKERRNGV